MNRRRDKKKRTSAIQISGDGGGTAHRECTKVLRMQVTPGAVTHMCRHMVNTIRFLHPKRSSVTSLPPSPRPSLPSSPLPSLLHRRPPSHSFIHPFPFFFHSSPRPYLLHPASLVLFVVPIPFLLNQILIFLARTICRPPLRFPRPSTPSPSLLPPLNPFSFSLPPTAAHTPF